MTTSIHTTKGIRQLAEQDMMAIEAIVASVYQSRCEGMTGYVLFDGGAHRGYHTLRMGALRGCELVYAVEADPAMAKDLRGVLKKAVKDPSMLPGRGGKPPVFRMVTKALQKDPKVKSVTWKSSTSHIGRSSIAATTGDGETIWGSNPDIEYRKDKSIPATTIDKILEGERRPLPFIKLDLEGADLVSLMGARKTLKDKRPIVAFENSVHAPRVHGFELTDFINYLNALDYVALDFVGNRLDESNWFSFFEAWMAPVEHEEWLVGALRHAVEQQAVKGGVVEGRGNLANAAAGGQGRGSDNGSRGALMGITPEVLKADLMDRMRKNNVTDVIATLSDRLPPETRTYGWDAMSTDIARIFWFQSERADQRVEGGFPANSWHAQAKSYHTRIQRVMRDLVKEGLSFQQLTSMPAAYDPGQQWMLDSGRLAWLLWLSGQRSLTEGNEAEEKKLWSEEAAEYRGYVRASLRTMRASAIVFAE